MSAHRTLSILLAVAVSALLNVQRAAAEDNSPNAGFAGADFRDVRTALREWIDRVASDEEAARRATDPWTDDGQVAQKTGEELLDLLIESFAAVDRSTEQLVASSWGSGPLEDVVYDGIRDVPVYRDHVRLFRARWLTQHRYFDEALVIYDRLSPEDVVDPAGLFFYRAICQSELLQRDAALDSLNLLLEHTLDVPSRFRTVAGILRKELDARNDEGLDQVSHLMSDVHRHLDLGRSGDRVQKREKSVIDAIDELLEKLEEQKNQQQQQQNGGQQNQPGRNQQPSGQPAPDSRIAGSQGDGQADRKNLEETGSWGLLDRQEEARARELIQQQLPASYLDIISDYTRKIAEQE